MDQKSKPEVDLKAKTAKKPKARVSRRQVAVELKVTARQFVRLRGFRWERSAGFLHDMKRQFPTGQKTRAEWDQLWTAFWDRPVKSC